MSDQVPLEVEILVLVVETQNNLTMESMEASLVSFAKQHGQFTDVHIPVEICVLFFCSLYYLSS